MLDVFELSYLYKDIHLDRLVINYSEKNNCYDVAMISQDMTIMYEIDSYGAFHFMRMMHHFILAIIYRILQKLIKL